MATDGADDELAEFDLSAPASAPARPTDPPPAASPGRPEPGPRADGEPSAEPPISGRARLLLGLSIAAMTLLWAAPLAIFLYVCALFFGPALGAELMEAAGGLRPTTFGGAFWLALVIVLAVLGGAGWRWARRLRDPAIALGLLGRPGATLTVGASLSVAVTVGWESTGADLPDAVVTATILVALFGGVVVLPLLLGRLVWRTARRAWRSRNGPGYRAGLWTGLGFGLALVAGLDGAADWPGEDGESFADGFEQQIELAGGALLAGVDQAAGRDGLDAVHEVFESTSEQLYVSASGGFATARGGFAPPAPSLFEDCVHLLMGGGEGRSRRDEAVRRLQRRGTSLSTAEDVAQYAVLETCEKYAGGGVTAGVERYFNAVINKAAAYEFRRWGRRACGLDALPERFVDPSPDVVRQFKAVEAAMCQLPPADRTVLEMAGEGLKSPEIAEALGIAPAAARQRLKRARKKLRAALGQG